MNNLFKLTFTPIVNGYESINKYRVKVEYFNNNIIGAKFDMRKNSNLGFAVFFIKDFIDVTEYYLDGCLVKTRTLTSLIDNDCTIEKRHIDSYIEAINKVKPHLEKHCIEEQKKEDCLKTAYEEWEQEKPIEYSF